MKLNVFVYCLFFLGIASCNSQKAKYLYESEKLKIEQLSENTFLHITYLKTETFGNVACNGLIVIDNGEAIIFDTPANNADSKALIDWVESALNSKVKGVVATHHHVDCLGGLNEFHKRKIPSYASNKTIELAKLANRALPQNGFDNQLELNVGNKQVVNAYFGEGHTKDNFIGYFPSEKVLFGGCLIKSVGASKGNLEDANVDEWSKTVERVRTKYSEAERIIPGHGKPGGQELLDYTIELFN
jgi:metallo-beta-lactamase class B